MRKRWGDATSHLKSCFARCDRYENSYAKMYFAFRIWVRILYANRIDSEHHREWQVNMRQSKCRRYLSDKQCLANQHVQTRHFTLPTFSFIRQFGILSLRWILSSPRGSGWSCMSGKKIRKIFYTHGRHSTFVGSYVSVGGALCLLVTCRQERKWFARWRNVWKQCYDAHRFGTFFSLTSVRST